MRFRGMASIRRAFVARRRLPGCGTLPARLTVTSRRHAAIVTLPGKYIAEVSPPRPLTMAASRTLRSRRDCRGNDLAWTLTGRVRGIKSF
jgi:hypothetical protein